MPPPALYVNGRFWPLEGRHLSALDRGFTLGDGVFETMRARGERIFRLEDHLDRLERGAGVLALSLAVDRAAMAAALRQTLRRSRLAEAIVRLTVSRGPTDRRGLWPPPETSPSLTVWVSPFAGPGEEKYRQGYHAIIASIRRNETSPLSKIKSCNYLDNILARREAQEAGADEALLLNTQGQLAGGSACNLFVAWGQRLITPALACGTLPGITRAAVQALAEGLGIPLEEGTVSPEELGQSDEAFLTSTVMGLMPLTRLDGRLIGSGEPGELTQTLAATYQAALREELGEEKAES